MNTKLIIAAALSLFLVGGVSLAEAGQHRSGGSGGSAGRAAPRGGAPAGTAVPRTGPPPHGGSAPYRPYYYGSRYGYGYYGYGYPYGYYPYGLGLSFGFGYGYPYGYAYGGYGYPYGYAYSNGYAYPNGYGYGGYAAGSYGGVQITGAQREAAVYADGYYVGIVDDFDGAFQRVNLEAGPHHIEIVPPQGGQPVSFDVNVRPGQTVTYRAN